MQETKYLMVAPKCLRNKILSKMDEQIALAKRGEPGYIGAKMNSLTDKRIIEKLMEASLSLLLQIAPSGPKRLNGLDPSLRVPWPISI